MKPRNPAYLLHAPGKETLPLLKKNRYISAMMPVNLQKKYPGLVWSNPKASAEIYIRQALLRPNFSRLFSMAGDFGVSALKKQWTILKVDEGIEVKRATPEVERILKNMEKGVALGRQK